MCPTYPKDVELYATGRDNLKLVDSQFAEREKNLGQVISACDYQSLLRFLLERRRRLIGKFFSSGYMNIDDFLFSNELLLTVQKYKSYGIRQDLMQFNAVVQIYKSYRKYLDFLEDIKDGRYLLSRNPPNNVFRLKYCDVIYGEILTSYGLVQLKSVAGVDLFHYHDVIETRLRENPALITTDYAPFFEHLWPLAVSIEYLTKHNYQSSLMYQYSVTPTDMANILSVIFSMKDDRLTPIPVFNLFQHYLAQPVRDRSFTDFLNLLSGGGTKIPIVFVDGDTIMLDRKTLYIFFILMLSQYLSSGGISSGQQSIARHKQQAGTDFEYYMKEKLEKNGYRCLPPSTNICGRDYDLIAISEARGEIILAETKFRDPSPSSFSNSTLIKQEFTDERSGLLQQSMRHQERYSLFFEQAGIFKQILGLNREAVSYSVRGYVITKFKPLISRYGDILIESKREFLSRFASDKN